MKIKGKTVILPDGTEVGDKGGGKKISKAEKQAAREKRRANRTKK